MPNLTYLRAILREPLVHFLLGGAAIFLFFAVRGEPVDPASRTIVVDAPRVQQLAARWEQTWQRTPTPAEIDALIRDYVKEEVYYREAKRLGLDENDLGIRQRLRIKMEYLAGAQVENVRPTDAVLQQWLDRNAARYSADATFAFDQIYLGPLDPDDAAGAARAARQAIATGADWSGLGKPISLPRSLENRDAADVNRLFGEGFADSLTGQPRGTWAGPVESGFGHHLVRVRGVTSAAPPQLADVRGDVENDWRAATVKDREAKAYQLLLDSYTITIRP